LELGVIDGYSTELGAAVEGADMVVLAPPLGAMREILAALRPALDPGTVLTDVGSAKRCVLEDARAVFGAVPPFFIPGHPIAGTEHSGVEASFASLFVGRKVILTPVESSSDEALARVRAMWEATGAEVICLPADHHDQVLAATSHLPHLLAYTLVDTLGRMDEHAQIFRFAAGGFRDFTRIASSDPTMWHDICLANRTALVAVLERYLAELGAATEAVRAGDGAALWTLFTRAKGLRDRHVRSDA
jgi:prephenate dehydrogenase